MRYAITIEPKSHDNRSQKTLILTVNYEPYVGATQDEPESPSMCEVISVMDEVGVEYHTDSYLDEMVQTVIEELYYRVYEGEGEEYQIDIPDDDA